MSRGNLGPEIGPLTNPAVAREEERTTSLELSRDSQSKNMEMSKWIARNNPLDHEKRTLGDRPPPPPPFDLPPAPSQSDLRLSLKVVDRTPAVSSSPSSLFSSAPLGIVSSGCSRPHPPCPSHANTGAVLTKTDAKTSSPPPPPHGSSRATDEERSFHPKLPDTQSTPVKTGSAPPRRPSRPLSLRLPDPRTDVLSSSSSSSSSSTLSPCNGSPISAHKLAATAGGSRSPSHARFINRHKYREKTPAVESATCFSFVEFASRLFNLDSFLGEGLLGSVQGLCRRWKVLPPCDMQRCRFPELLRVYRYRVFFFLFLACISLVIHQAKECCLSVIASLTFASLWVAIGAMMCCSKTYKWTSNLLTGVFTVCLVSTHPWLVSIRETLPFSESLHIFVGCAFLLILPQADQWVIPTHTRVLCHLATTFLYVLSCILSPNTSSSSSSSLSDSGGDAVSSSSSSFPSPVYTCTGAVFWWVAHLLFYCSDFFLSEIFALSCMGEAEEASNFMVEQLFKCWSPGGINVVALTDKHRQCTWISKDAHQVFAPEVQQQFQRGAGAAGKPTHHHHHPHVYSSSERKSSRSACDDLQGKGIFGTTRNGEGPSDPDPSSGMEADGLLASSSSSACRGFLTKRRSSYHNLSSLPDSPCLSSSTCPVTKKPENIAPEVEIHSCSSSSFSPSNPSSFHLDSPSPGETPSSRSYPAKSLFDGRPDDSLTHGRPSVTTDEEEENNGKTPYGTRKKKAYKFIRQLFTFQKIRSLLLSHFTSSSSFSYRDHQSLGRFSTYSYFIHQQPQEAHCYSSLFSLFDLVVSKTAYLFRRLATLTPPPRHWLTVGQKPSPSQSFLQQQHVQTTSKTEGERADAALIGLSLDTWIHPDDRAVFAAIFERADGDTPGTPEFHFADYTPQSKPSPAKLLAELARRRLGAVASSSSSTSSSRRETTAAGLLQEDGRCIVRVLRPSSRLTGGAGAGAREETKRLGEEYEDLSLHLNNEGGLLSSSSRDAGDQTNPPHRSRGSCSVILSPSSHLSHSKGERCPRREYDEEIRGGGPGREEGGQASFSSLSFLPCSDDEHRSYSDNDYLYYEVSVTPCRYPWTSSRVRLTRYNVSFYNIDERVRLQKQLESLVLAMSETLGIAAWAFDTHSDHSGCRKSRAKQGDEETDDQGDRGRGSHRSSLQSEDRDSEEDGALSRHSLSPPNGLNQAALGGRGGLLLNQEEEKRRGETRRKTTNRTPTNKEPLSSSSSSPSVIPGYGSPSRYSYIFTEQAYKKMTGREISTTEQMRLFQAGSALWYVHANRRQKGRVDPSAGDNRRITRCHEYKKGKLGGGADGEISSTDGKGSDLPCDGGQKVRTPLLHHSEEFSKKTPNLLEICSNEEEDHKNTNETEKRSPDTSSSFATQHDVARVQQEERGLHVRRGEGDVEEGMASAQSTEKDKKSTNQLYQRERGDHHHHAFDHREFVKGKEEDTDERGDDDYEAALQGTWLQYFMEPGRGRLIQALKELFEEKKPFKLELPYERADGEMRWFKVAGYASSDSSLFWGLIQDATTDRTQLNEEERSRALLTLLTDCQFSGWGVADIGFETEQIIEASTSLNRLFGRDVKGHHYSIVIPSDVIPQLEAEGYCSEYKVALRVNHDNGHKKDRNGEEEGEDGRGEAGEQSSSCDQSCWIVPRPPHPPQRKLMSLTAVADPSDPSIAVFGVKELQQEGQGRAHPLSLLTDCQFDGWGVADIFETEQIIEASSSLNRLLRRDVRGLHYCIVIPPTVIPQLEAEGWCFEHPVVLRDLSDETHHHCFETNCPHSHEKNEKEAREKESHTTEREEERGRYRGGEGSCCHDAIGGKEEEEQPREGRDETLGIGERRRCGREGEEEKSYRRDGGGDGEEKHSYVAGIEERQKKSEERSLHEREGGRNVDHCRHATTDGEKKEDEEERSSSSPSSPCTCTHHQAAHPQSRVMALTAVVDPTDGSLVVFGLRDLHMTYQEALIELHNRDHTASQEGENAGGGGQGHPPTASSSSSSSSSSPFPLPSSSSTYPSTAHHAEHHEKVRDGAGEAGVMEARQAALSQVYSPRGNLPSDLSPSSQDVGRKYDGVGGREDAHHHDGPVSGGPRSEGTSSSSSSSPSSPVTIHASIVKKNQQSLHQQEKDKSGEGRGTGWMYTGMKKGDETTQTIRSMCMTGGRTDEEVTRKQGESSSSSFPCRCHHCYDHYSPMVGGCQERPDEKRMVQGEDQNARGERQEASRHQPVFSGGVHTPYPTHTPHDPSNNTNGLSPFFISSPFLPPPHTSMAREEESPQHSSSLVIPQQYHHELPSSSSSSLSRVETAKTTTKETLHHQTEEEEKEKSCSSSSPCHPCHHKNDSIHTASSSHGKVEESKGDFRHEDSYLACQSSSHFYPSYPYPSLSSRHHSLSSSGPAGLSSHAHRGEGGGGGGSDNRVRRRIYESQC